MYFLIQDGNKKGKQGGLFNVGGLKILLNCWRLENNISGKPSSLSMKYRHSCYDKFKYSEIVKGAGISSSLEQLSPFLKSMETAD